MSTQEYETQTERQYSSAAGATNHESIPRDNRGSSSSSRHYSSNYARYYISQTSGQSSRETEPPQASYTPSKISGKAPEQIIPSDHVECACGTKEGLCGIIFWPEEPLPKDGKITEQKKSLSKKSGSSGNKHTSSKPKGNTPHSKVFLLRKLFLSIFRRINFLMFYRQGTAGGCGPLWGPGITPEPPPQKPDPDASSEEKNEYRKRQAEWNAAYDVWKDISCPCGWGYFNLEGIWIDGAMVRKRLEPSNPLWAENSGRSPQNIREMKGERGNLFERGQIGGHGHPESRINVRFD
jgi:hypothetical protein